MKNFNQLKSQAAELAVIFVKLAVSMHSGLFARCRDHSQAYAVQRHFELRQRSMKIKNVRILAGLFLAIILTQPTIAQPLPDGLYYTIQQKSSGRFVDAYTGNQHDSAAVLRHVQFNDTQKWQFTPVPGFTDIYTIQQLSNSRFLDAYEDNNNGNDYGVVTRHEESNTTQLWQLIPQGNDTYTVQQQSTMRFLDAHDDSFDDFALVTRNQQDDDSQQWVIKAVELKGTYLIQHKETGRLVDAYENNGNDHAMVHRPHQKNLTQRWEFTPLGNNTYTIKQNSSGRFVDAYTDNDNGHNFGMVTRNQQNNDTQKWIVTPIGNDTFTIRQKSNGRYVDAYVKNNDFALVTRGPQNDGSQEWKIVPQLRGTYTVQQKSNERYLDAHIDNDNGADYKLVTNPAQNNDTQHWLFTPLDGDTYTIQQWNNSRFVDAYTSSVKDHRLVNRPLQTDDTQKWTLTYLGGDSYRIQQKSNSRFMDAYQNDGYEVVTRNIQNNDSQQWLIKHASIPNPGVAYGSASLVNGEGLSSVTDIVDDLVLEYLRRNKIPGATVAASRDGKLIMSKGYGYKSVETEVPMQPSSLTRIGSVSKVLTTIGFMKLSELTPWLSPETRVYGQTGALSHPSYMSAIFAQQLDHEDPSPLDWYVNMKVNHLLSHTAGFNKVGKGTVAAALGIDASDVTFRQIHQYNLENRNLKFEPGTQKDYENHHMGTAGQIIEEVSGQLYRNFITTSILNPLGLTNVIPEDGITLGLDSEPHTLTHSGTSASVIDVNPTTTAIAAGGWMASAESMVRLMVATDKLSNQPDILSPGSIDLMETAPYPNATGDKYALGWAIACQNDSATTPPCRLGHNGKVSGGYAYITKFLEGYDLDGQDVGGVNVAILLNMNKGGGVKELTWEIAKLIGNATIPPGYDLFWSGGILK